MSTASPLGTSRDGDGWAACRRGHEHWGVHGAAGLLLVAPDPAGRACVLLQHRALWSHHGGTWGVPGGARGSRETPQQTALREAAEETGLDPLQVDTTASYVDDHGGWTYTTVLAAAPALLPVHAEDRESAAVSWVLVRVVDAMALHPGFAASWPRLRSMLP